ncbi:RagB/SusD family nutrient uptake outer membrane protein [Pontibacter silvestris]|uniref:RagB/SusD family nutrient uptake outer membrane protein n=1 Tax=Pontibacter silvestris TaxID=2305183 RepID=A0ABW4X105_9BACT|nr:RagB/SusD family nutrient uptake outer membrane protein [Pontibacter silvestris]MCC9135598.1 RagB/SusD family nutrient uptake outer membrane protein [Pontibacter silvestris]
MKKISVVLLSVLLLGISACEDDLDQAPISDASAANFYRNTADFQQGVTGIYNALTNYPVRRFNLSEVRSDNIFAPGVSGVRDWNPVNNFEKTLETNPLIIEAWNTNYNGILRANTVLDKINETAVPDATVRSRLIGEAKFLRAFYYFDLVRLFGRVPLFDKTVSPDEALSIPRSPVADVYQLIISDLEDAIANLPESYDASNKGKATSHAARGILALVHLTRSGPQLHPDGPTLGLNEYDRALTLLNEIINSGQYSFVNDYASIFSYTNENNPDIVFDVQAVGGNAGDVGVGSILPTEMYEEPFARAIGIPFAGGIPIDGPKAPSDDLLNSFQESDVRDDFSILPSYTDPNGALVNRAQFVKFLDVSKAGVDRFNWPINFPVLRYTDVLLMKAEAILMSGAGGSQNEVDGIVNDVRARANLDPVSNVDMDMLLAERRREFLAEGLRWHDLVRTGKVIDVITAWDAVEDVTNKMSPITVNDIIYPIPQTQLDVKEGLYEQNPGY